MSPERTYREVGKVVGRVVRFWRLVDRTTESGCWEWRGSITSAGYGDLGVDGQHWSAHRFSWVLANGDLPDSAVVMHLCDNRICVRPDHLSVGDYVANVADMFAKGRANPSNRDKTHCKYGHEFTPENTYTRHRGGRTMRACRTCIREYKEQLKQDPAFRKKERDRSRARREE